MGCLKLQTASDVQYLSQDPLGHDSGDDNYYVYGGNNPLINVDPDGLAKCTYTISGHTLSCRSNDDKGSPLVLGPAGVFSGNGVGIADNPAQENNDAGGPIPTGSFSIEPHPTKNKFYRLVPSLWTRARHGFRHGFELHPGSVSLGCITADKENKNAMCQFDAINSLLKREAGANSLEVTP